MNEDYSPNNVEAVLIADDKGLTGVALAPTRADPEELKKRRFFAKPTDTELSPEYDLPEVSYDKILSEVLTDVFPGDDRLSSFEMMNLARKKVTGRNAIVFTQLPIDALRQLGTSAYIASKEDLFTPGEIDMLKEHGVPPFFGEDPIRYLHKDFATH
jgi:hypothetical protein